MVPIGSEISSSQALSFEKILGHGNPRYSIVRMSETFKIKNEIKTLPKLGPQQISSCTTSFNYLQLLLI